MAIRPKSINGLMKYLRDDHNISISGSSQKRKLRNIGYFHGYKGYRYNRTPNNSIAYTNFDEVLAMNEFDMSLKNLFYSQMMFIETALKNYVLEVVIDEARTSSFNDIFANLLTHYKSFSTGSQDYNRALRTRLDLRNRIYSTLTRDHSKKLVVKHFIYRDRNVPIWAIFEVISLGDFGTFFSCLNQPTKLLISNNLHLNRAFDATGTLTESMIFTIKELRNSVAHNDVIFDTRFKHFRIPRALISCLENDTRIRNIDFSTIVDYLLLICYLLKKLQVHKLEIRKMIKQFEFITETLRRKIPINIYNQIVLTNTRNKLRQLEIYVKA